MIEVRLARSSHCAIALWSEGQITSSFVLMGRWIGDGIFGFGSWTAVPVIGSTRGRWVLGFRNDSTEQQHRPANHPSPSRRAGAVDRLWELNHHGRRPHSAPAAVP